MAVYFWDVSVDPPAPLDPASVEMEVVPAGHSTVLWGDGAKTQINIWTDVPDTPNPDAPLQVPVLMSFTVGHGNLTILPNDGLDNVVIEAGGQGQPSITISGQLLWVGKCMSYLQYTPTPGWNGADSLTMTLEETA